MRALGTGEANVVEGASPFLKWAGGKQRLLFQYAPYFPSPETIDRYFEPFIGSAAVFFRYQFPRATLSDQNEKLVEAYQMVQQEVESVIEALRPHRNEAQHYYQVRAQDPSQLSPAERVARLIFLNKTCYNGLYRENRKGEFNVPFGRYKNPTICDETKLRLASRALKGVKLVAQDFATAVETAGAGDFIYLDPPYVPLTSTSSFTSYNKLGFGQADQRRLADCVNQLTAKGCRVMLSNSSADLVYSLYQGHGYQLVPIQARRNINSRADRRGPVQELLILNYRP